MSDRLKRVLTVIGFLVAVAAIAAGLYVVFLKGPSEPVLDGGGVTPSAGVGETGEGLPVAGVGTPVVIPGEQAPSAGLPTASPVAAGGVTKTEVLTAGGVISPTLTNDGKDMAYYDRADGRFYAVNDKGEIERLSDKTFPKVETVTWNPAGEKAVLEFPDGSNVLYDFELEKQVSFPAHWEDFAFSPVTDQVIAKSIGVDPNNRSLVVSDTDGTNTKAIAALGENADKVQVNWSPNNQIVAFSDTGPAISGFGRRLMIPIGKNQENYKAITVEGFDFQSRWSPQGNKLLFSSVGSENGYRPTLWVTDGGPNSIGNNRRLLGIDTWADKCTFGSNSTLYCAVPEGLPANSGLQRAIASDVPDALYRINIDTGLRERIAVPETAQSIRQVSLSADGKTLFFTDAASGVLQRIRLP